MLLPKLRKLGSRSGSNVVNRSRTFVAKVLSRYTSAIFSGPGLGMLVATIVLSTLVYVNHNLERALVAGSILFVFLITTLAVRR